MGNQIVGPHVVRNSALAGDVLWDGDSDDDTFEDDGTLPIRLVLSRQLNFHSDLFICCIFIIFIFNVSRISISDIGPTFILFYWYLASSSASAILFCKDDMDSQIAPKNIVRKCVEQGEIEIDIMYDEENIIDRVVVIAVDGMVTVGRNENTPHTLAGTLFVVSVILLVISGWLNSELNGMHALCGAANALNVTAGMSDYAPDTNPIKCEVNHGVNTHFYPTLLGDLFGCGSGVSRETGINNMDDHTLNWATNKDIIVSDIDMDEEDSCDTVSVDYGAMYYIHILTASYHQITRILHGNMTALHCVNGGYAYFIWFMVKQLPYLLLSVWLLFHVAVLYLVVSIVLLVCVAVIYRLFCAFGWIIPIQKYTPGERNISDIGPKGTAAVETHPNMLRNSNGNLHMYNLGKQRMRRTGKITSRQHKQRHNSNNNNKRAGNNKNNKNNKNNNIKYTIDNNYDFNLNMDIGTGVVIQVGDDEEGDDVSGDSGTSGES